MRRSRDGGEVSAPLIHAATSCRGTIAGRLTWQAFPVVMFRLTKKSWVDLGYRWLDMDYSAGEGADTFSYDVLSQGPVLGFTFQF